MKLIRVTGDTHGEHGRFIYAHNNKEWDEKDIIIVCGDFGYIFRNNEEEKKFLDEIENWPYTFCFVDGNHENFAVINSLPVETWNGGKVHKVKNNVYHLMRGQVFQIEGKKIFTFGGAYSMDRIFRTLNRSYWEEEIPNGKEYKEAVENLRKHDNKVDYILTHTAPREMILRMGFTPHDRELELAGFLEFLMHEIEHKHWFCGHWHKDLDLSDKFTVLWFETRILE